MLHDFRPQPCCKVPGRLRAQRAYTILEDLMLSVNDRVLGLLLGLGDLDGPELCHGYANGCICGSCCERELAVSELPARVKQPWETAA
jgi:hypothetical protein